MSELGSLATSDSSSDDSDERAGVRDFDFLHGRWRVHNRRRPRSAACSAEWEEFEGRSVVRPLWDGAGNMEEWEASPPGGVIRAISLHLYDAGAHQWRLHWATERDGRVGVPTVGSFDRGRGEFFAQEDIAGRSTLLRITWEELSPYQCRWEQSFSHDGGRSWQLDWTMAFTRE
jgi:hypothetical protein